MAEKKRLDVAVFEKNLAESREKAKALIMSGEIYVNNTKQLKSGFLVSGEDCIELRGKNMPYVSRGGYKLEKAIIEFGLSLEGCTCMDIGASTGGFTDAMLQNGAKKVYSIDVGYGQLAWKLRNDERVVNLERTNFRYCTKEQIPEMIDFAVVDVSFISLKIIIPVMKSFLKDSGSAVCLIKPQFEAGRENVGKNGVVKDKQIHIEVVDSIYRFVIENGFLVLGIDYSPIKGPQGNIEYLIYIKNDPDKDTKQQTLFDIKEMVNNSHTALK